MQLTAEIKEDHYNELPRQPESAAIYPAAGYVKTDASTGRNYIDLNAAAQTYSGAWLFGKENVQVSVNGMNGQWTQWCPVPAGIADGVWLRGNVIYQAGSGSGYRTSNDRYEGVIRTEFGTRYFRGRTQHTFVSRNLPGGSMQVVANLRIPLTQQLAYNPMVQIPSVQTANAARYASPPQQAYAPQTVRTYAPQDGYGYAQQPDAGF